MCESLRLGGRVKFQTFGEQFLGYSGKEEVRDAALGGTSEVKPTAGQGGVRLRVAYKSPEALLGELTKSVGRGGVRIESKRPMPIGTKFVFELHSQGVADTVEVIGTVLAVTESAPGKFLLQIRYEPPQGRQGLEAVIRRIFEVSKKDPKRRSARVPFQVRAVENRPGSPTYRLRNVSSGGAGLDVEADAIPPHVFVGTPFLMQMRLLPGLLSVAGEVVWAVSSGNDPRVRPRIGVAFATLPTPQLTLLHHLILLREMPHPPWIAKIAFGQDVGEQWVHP